MTASEYQQLIEFLGEQFTALDQRFVAIDQRFDRLERRFDGLQEHMDERFREVFGHFDAIYGRLERLEQEYVMVTQALRRIEAMLADEAGRRDLLERNLSELKRHVAALQTRIEEIEQHIARPS